MWTHSNAASAAQFGGVQYQQNFGNYEQNINPQGMGGNFIQNPVSNFSPNFSQIGTFPQFQSNINMFELFNLFLKFIEFEKMQSQQTNINAFQSEHLFQNTFAAQPVPPNISTLANSQFQTFNNANNLGNQSSLLAPYLNSFDPPRTDQQYLINFSQSSSNSLMENESDKDEESENIQSSGEELLANFSQSLSNSSTETEPDDEDGEKESDDEDGEKEFENFSQSNSDDTGDSENGASETFSQHDSDSSMGTESEEAEDSQMPQLGEKEILKIFLPSNSNSSEESESDEDEDGVMPRPGECIKCRRQGHQKPYCVFRPRFRLYCYHCGRANTVRPKCPTCKESEQENVEGGQSR